MIKLDKYKTYISYQRGNLPGFVMDVLGRYKIKLGGLLISEDYDKKSLWVKYEFEDTDYVFFVDDIAVKGFDEIASEVINKMMRHRKTVDVSGLKKIAKLQIIKYKRK